MEYGKQKIRAGFFDRQVDIKPLLTDEEVSASLQEIATEFRDYMHKLIEAYQFAYSVEDVTSRTKLLSRLDLLRANLSHTVFRLPRLPGLTKAEESNNGKIIGFGLDLKHKK